MDDRYNERYRRGQVWRGYEGSGGGRHQERWGSDEWQPESDDGSWQGERRRQQLSPGQLSDGGPARDDAGYDREYGQGRYPDHPNHPDRPDHPGHPGRSQGDYRKGSDLRYGLNGQYEPEDADTWPGERSRYRNRDQDWLRDMDRSREDTQPAYGRGYFSDVRGDTAYGHGQGTYRGDERGNPRGGYPSEYRGEYAGGYRSNERQDFRGGERSDPWADQRENQRTQQWDRERSEPRRAYREASQEPEEHGALYHLGRRIGEAVGEVFGQPQGRRVGPKGYQRSDERIRETVCEHLAYAGGVDVRDVSVEVASGLVTLTGTVRTRSEKYDIEDLADTVFGVTEVQNNIRVQRDRGLGGVGGSGVSRQGSAAASGTASVASVTASAATPSTCTSATSGVAAQTATPAKMTDLKTWTPE
ncbi:BON domain-containing protein [Cupriavidus sp. CuC1]|uniref:BON domain-containing protein n=1 Tax=Cupriavidus sp. CuC1 TaxID=3373131 RepID=UPI0037D4BFEA